ncbi:MAG: hypothetical protein AAF458_23655 [Pseudomonadota bacterium]
MKHFPTELAADYVEATHGRRPAEAQAERVARVAASMRKTLSVTAEASLFDTEPDQLQATLIALADPEDQ